jgi:hypothetical protein
MPPTVKTYTFGHGAYGVVDSNGNGKIDIDQGEIIGVMDGRSLSRADAEKAMKDWGINGSRSIRCNKGLFRTPQHRESRIPGRTSSPSGPQKAVQELRIDGMIEGLLYALSTDG